MKKKMNKALSLLLGLGLLLSALPFAVSAAKDSTLYRWTASTLEKDKKVFSSNLIAGSEVEVRWNESGVMHTQHGTQNVFIHNFLNETSDYEDSAYGLPQTVQTNGKTTVEPLKLAFYPSTSDERAKAVGVSFVYAFKPNEKGINVAGNDSLRAYVSEDGMNWSEDSVGIRSAQIVGSGTTAKGEPVIYYQVNTENLLDIDSFAVGDLLQGVRFVLDNGGSTTRGSFAISELTVTGYESKNDFEAAVPAASRTQESASVDEAACRKALVEAAMNSEARTEIGVIQDAVALVSNNFPEDAADLLSDNSVQVVEGVATQAAERVHQMLDWIVERDVMTDEYKDQIIADYETITTTANIVWDLNTPQQIMRGYANAKPGDMLLQVTETLAHVYMITDNAPVFLADRVNLDINKSTMTYLTEKGLVTKTYFDAFAKDTFVPMILSFLAEGQTGATQMDVHATAVDGIRVAVVSGLSIRACEITVGGQTIELDTNGTTGLVCTDKKLTDAVAALADGKHEMTVTMTSGVSEPIVRVVEIEVKDGKATVLGTVAPDHDAVCQSKAMTDVDKNAWYHGAVDYALANGLMGGYNATTFGPNDTLSRAMVVQVLYNKEGQPAISGKHNFTDVPADQWFNNAVTWGTQKGVMGGYGDGKFGPNDNVTVEQLAVILWNYSGNPAFTGKADSVGTHSGWAANGLAWALENGILDNVPYENVTVGASRAQTAQMLMNYLTKN